MTQSLLRWPEPEQILNQVRLWAAQVAAEHPGLERAPGRAAGQRLRHGHRPATGQPLVVASVAISQPAGVSGQLG
ncbi:hypothetical protein KBZ12_17270 [Cyanobium sp. Cruz CV13-4-11]|uniref:hypothetical protein n=1 Tax=unclassified Cyanobium TaxID=2627006 RepID=UPI0020CBEA04|nr:MULTISPECIES: hypothetical protein [unclassified Cyanobium]MCP9902323.1 hypothetical protein [Cyanobium sp. Cruz CV11-17]MCP9921193.1 hypothetical protein [Cyanobium sp. Cruz CV13-4-11]